ncbi:MAG: hypothetical protein ACKVSF_03785 [Alphaproteobacteria bacterium]
MDILGSLWSRVEHLRDLWRRMLGVETDGWREVPTSAKIGPIEVDSGHWGLDIAGVILIALVLYAGKNLIDGALAARRAKDKPKP